MITLTPLQILQNKLSTATANQTVHANAAALTADRDQKIIDGINKQILALNSAPDTASDTENS